MSLLLLLSLHHTSLVVSVLTTATSNAPIVRLRHSLSVLLLILIFVRLFVVILYLSINLSNAVRDLQISGPHICSPTINMTHLHLCDKHARYFLIIVTHKTKSSTSFGQWITNDLIFFDLSKLLEMLLESLIS